jgi:hypothetical protein
VNHKEDKENRARPNVSVYEADTSSEEEGEERGKRKQEGEIDEERRKRRRRSEVEEEMSSDEAYDAETDIGQIFLFLLKSSVFCGNVSVKKGAQLHWRDSVIRFYV